MTDIKPFPLEVNEARGEVGLTIGDVPIVIVVEMARLAAISSRLQCKSMTDLFLRLSSVEIAATMAGIEFLTVRGNAKAALEKLNIRHYADVAAAFEKALTAHIGEDSGNGQGAETEKP